MYLRSSILTRVGNFRQKNYSAEDGIDERICLFRQNSGCSRNSVPNRSAEEKNTLNSLPWNKIRCKRSEFRPEPFRGREYNSEFRSLEQHISKYLEFCSEPFHGRDNYSEFRSEACLGRNMLSILFAGAGFFVKLIMSCHFLPFRASE